MSLKPGLDGAWLVQWRDVTCSANRSAQQRHSGYPTRRRSANGGPAAWRGAECDLWSEARGIASEAVFSRASKGVGAGSCCGYTALAVYAPSQSRPTCLHLGLVFVFCCLGARRVTVSVPRLVLARMECSKEDIFKFIVQHDLFFTLYSPCILV
jgi:hypothetical protein